MLCFFASSVGKFDVFVLVIIVLMVLCLITGLIYTVKRFKMKRCYNAVRFGITRQETRRIFRFAKLEPGFSQDTFKIRNIPAGCHYYVTIYYKDNRVINWGYEERYLKYY